uniref:hypothetical protein n=1 Tax=Clostridium sp. (strain ATCC 29733 / VPI C48-50) TaxID=1507 RepID=UPI001A99A3FC
MKHKGIQRYRLPPVIVKEYFVHTAILKGIAVFFCSTPIYFFTFEFPFFNIYFDLEAFAVRRAPQSVEKPGVR